MGLSVCEYFAILFISGYANGQPPLPENTCKEYNKISNGSLTFHDTFHASKSKMILKGGAGFESVMEVPGPNTWIPQCDEAGLYTKLQKRQNNQLFCVLPQTGEIVFDPSKTTGTNVTEDGMCLCDCFVQRRIVISGHQREMIPRCNEKMGFYELVQMLPNGMLQCTLLNGTSLSSPIFYNGTAEGGAEAACFAVMFPLTTVPASDPATVTASLDMGPRNRTTKKPNHAPVRARLDKDSKYE
ncbi:hypothetical protein BV898_16962 [Hypsibius exemplaris]|uniref:Thyroglobulin type-1 domain-containing protein n=1 Tax=Hypsibius exemplaris TaxID=2072580 RepID=A0A9X6NEP0_HYPEX|nr:hypothetical protein BV898_16962 [Hypsibius exemplaris]